jgi:hypothetical protein
MVSCNMTTPSIIFLPGMKAVWVGLISFSAIPLILFKVTLVKILKLMFNKHIGQKCLICVACCCFGNSMMIPKFRLNRGNVPS